MSDRVFEVGETALLQEVWKGRLWSARPMIVVEDRSDYLALWYPTGTTWKAPSTPPTRVRASTRTERIMSNLAKRDWVLEDRRYDVSSLWLAEPGADHAVWVSWLGTGEHWGWYINLQEPFRRTDRGFQWMDLMLDVIVEPDRNWKWKDEDDFAAMIDRGLIDPAHAEAVRREGEKIIRRVEGNEPPFSEPWPAWRPDPNWPIPALPHDWHRI